MAVQAAVVPTSCRVEKASIPRLDRNRARSGTDDSNTRAGMLGAGPGMLRQRGTDMLPCFSPRSEARTAKGDPAYQVSLPIGGLPWLAGWEVGHL